MQNQTIDFDVYFDELINKQYTETVRVNFDWDEKEDIMKVACRELEKQLSSHPCISYQIAYWWWVGDTHAK